MVDRPDVDTPQGAEPTGTNGRRQHHTRPREGRRHQPDCETHACGNEHEHAQAIETRDTRPPSGPRTVTTTRPAAQAQGRYNRICGGHGLGETPGPIPNPEAKTQHGNGTALGRVWESSTPPLHNSQGVPHGTRRDGTPSTYPDTPHPHHGANTTTPTVAGSGCHRSRRPESSVEAPRNEATGCNRMKKLCFKMRAVI